MNNKIECKICSVIKEYTEFPKTYCDRSKSLLGARRKVCKTCMTEKKRGYMKEYYIKKIKKKPKPKVNKYVLKDPNFNLNKNITIEVG